MKRKRISNLALDLDTDEQQDAQPKRKKQKIRKKSTRNRRQDQRSCHWIITWNHYPERGIDTLLSIGGLESYCIQEETGHQTGVPHYQGALSFRNAKKWSTLNRATDGKCWWEPARNIFAVRNYCSKIDTANGTIWRKGYQAGPERVKDPLDGKTLYNWQKRIIKIVEGPIDDREIHWIWSDKGGVGKSALVKHLYMKYGACISGGKLADAYYGIQQELERKKQVRIVLFDLPRSQRNNVTYEAVEGIKNGLFYATKYKSGACCYNYPHVIIFANVEPQFGEFSGDRWNVVQLDRESDLQHIPSNYAMAINRN